MYGDLGLEVLRSGLTAPEALKAMRSVDTHPERRQVAMADGHGNIGVYTGEACVGKAGHALGDGCVALANLMRSADVWSAMLEAYNDSDEVFSKRLIAALRAAEAHGGDRRGRRSAAILVVCAEPSGRPWRDQIVDLRVDDDPQPVERLAAMVEYNDRYHNTVEAFDLALDGDPERALHLLGERRTDPPEEPDLALWEAIVLALAGRWDEAEQIGARLITVAPELVDTARDFGDVGLVDASLVARVLEGASAR